jgi:hypothetical protein
MEHRSGPAYLVAKLKPDHPAIAERLAAGALTALGFNPAVRSRSAPMLVKDEIRPISNLPPDGNSTPNAALQDILPFDEHIGFE